MEKKPQIPKNIKRVCIINNKETKGIIKICCLASVLEK